MCAKSSLPERDRPQAPPITDLIGRLPYRMALAGGWIDQPFVSRHDPAPPGSMVVVALEPTFRWMDRCGMGTSTRRVAARLWGDQFPDRPRAALVRELYAAENRGRPDPSGSQDMIGLIYPGINRLDYAYAHEGGLFPQHIESTQDAQTARWLERVLQVLPVGPRPEGYSPLGILNPDPAWVRRLGQAGADCYAAILAHDVAALGASLNECMRCWEAILPHTVHHPTLTVDLMALWGHYRARYAGALYSGCGGGYLIVVSEDPVPGSLSFTIRLDPGADLR